MLPGYIPHGVDDIIRGYIEPNPVKEIVDELVLNLTDTSVARGLYIEYAELDPVFLSQQVNTIRDTIFVIHKCKYDGLHVESSSNTVIAHTNIGDIPNCAILLEIRQDYDNNTIKHINFFRGGRSQGVVRPETARLHLL